MKALDWLARGHAYMEAAEYLGMEWTVEDNPELFRAEMAQAAIVAKQLNREADKCFQRAKRKP